MPNLPPNAVSLFDALYAEHHRAVYAYLVAHLNARETAADLLQETFLRVWQHLVRAQEIPAERRRFWLLSIARNLLTDTYRRQQTQAKTEALWQEKRGGQDEYRTPEYLLEAQETQTALEEAIFRLPDDLRVVLTLHYLGEMTSAEIGVALQRPAGTVRYQLNRARQQLAAALGLKEEKRS